MNIENPSTLPAASESSLTPSKPFEPSPSASPAAVIKVIGVGGGGGNAVMHMVRQGIEGVECICANTDAQALRTIGALPKNIQIGAELTKGLGAGSHPEVGAQAAEADREVIRGLLEGADMVFITAGMGGGTGTGAAPVIAEIARQLDILTVGVVTRPFKFERGKRNRVADEGRTKLLEQVDSLITVQNDKLFEVLGKKATMEQAFAEVDNILYQSVVGISDLIIRPGQINLDFADVKSVMSNPGPAMMGIGMATGENRAEEAANEAIRSPLLENTNLEGAKGILVNVATSGDLGITEFAEINEVITSYGIDDSNIIVGTAVDESLGDQLKVTVVVTGLDANQAPGARKMPVSLQSAASVEMHRSSASERTRSSANEPVPIGSAAPRRRNTMPNFRDGEELDIPTFLRKQAD